MRGNFKKDLETGEIGEDVAFRILSNSLQTKSILDVRKDHYFQNLDIDFLVEKYSGIIIKYEVKTDRQAHKTGNIVFEKTTSGNVGCLEKSHADYILYYLPETQIMYGFWLSDIRKYIKATKPRVIEMGDAATGYLLNISELEQKGLIAKIYITETRIRVVIPKKSS